MNPCCCCYNNGYCLKHCDNFIKFYSRLIRANYRSGKNSKLWKDLLKFAQSHKLKKDFMNYMKLRRILNMSFNVHIMNKLSGEYHIFNTKGRMIDNGYQNPNEPPNQFKHLFKK
jgi:hypothetical protein